MIKRVLSTALLALLPMGAIHADNNITKQPFENLFANDPFFQDFQQLQSDMDKIFENFHQRAFAHMPKISIPSGFGSSGFSSTFKTDVNDKGDYYEIVADLPGMDKAKIDVKAENGMLSINAQSETQKEQKKGDKIIRQERFVGSFHRSMSLPKDANGDKMTTEYKDGILRVKIPKK